MGKQVNGRKVGRSVREHIHAIVDEAPDHRALFAMLDIGPSPTHHIHNAPGKPKGKS